MDAFSLLVNMNVLIYISFHKLVVMPCVLLTISFMQFNIQATILKLASIKLGCNFSISDCTV